MRGLTLTVLLTGCVVRYGGAPVGSASGTVAPSDDELVAPTRVAWARYERQLLSLMDEAAERDRVDRAQAALDLIGAVKHADPEVQHTVRRYVETLLAIEARALPVGTVSFDTRGGDVVFGPLAGGLIEEELAGPDPARPAGWSPEADVSAALPDGIAELLDAETGAAGTRTDAAELVHGAQLMLDVDQPGVAMLILEPCRDAGCWSEVAATWSDARDAYVHARRVAAGRVFQRARADTDLASRRKTLTRLRAEMAAIARRYPDSPEASALRRNIALVDRELDALGEQ